MRRHTIDGNAGNILQGTCEPKSRTLGAAWNPEKSSFPFIVGLTIGPKLSSLRRSQKGWLSASDGLVWGFLALLILIRQSHLIKNPPALSLVFQKCILWPFHGALAGGSGGSVTEEFS